MCRRLDAIEAVGREADKLTEVCEAALYGRLPQEPIAKVVHVAFREVVTTPPDMAAQLGRLR